MNKPWSDQHSCPPRLNSVTMSVAVMVIVWLLDEMARLYMNGVAHCPLP